MILNPKIIESKSRQGCNLFTVTGNSLDGAVGTGTGDAGAMSVKPETLAAVLGYRSTALLSP